MIAEFHMQYMLLVLIILTDISSDIMDVSLILITSAKRAMTSNTELPWNITMCNIR